MQRQQGTGAPRQPPAPARRRAEPAFMGSAGRASAQPSLSARVAPPVPRRVPVQAAPESGKPLKPNRPADAKPPPVPQRQSRHKNGK